MQVSRLTVATGPEQGKQFVVPARGGGIGRGHWNAIQLSDPQISRSHCILIPQSDGFMVVDCASRSGTRINGAALDGTHTLRSGDHIELGDTRLIYRAEPLSGRAASEPSAPTGAETLGHRYEILGLIAVGGMGSVYKVRDLELDEIVALKVIRRDLAQSPVMVEWFRREVKLARRVTHRNVARIFDIGEHNGEKFLTMEFIKGEPLGDLLARQGRVDTRTVVDIATEICHGLDAVHQVGIIHRDLKPDNILIAVDGRIVITDFGLAFEHETDASHAMLVGTPAYIAPEQVAGEPDIDARADIYSLGALMYELVTGEPPWTGDNPLAIASARFMESPPDPRAVAGIPDALAELVLRCMALEPDRRYPDVKHIIAALGRIVPEPIDDRISVASAARVRHDTVIDYARKQIAVLPLRNQGDPDDAYIADGITDDLIHMLAMAPGLRVCPRDMVERASDPELDPRSLARALGAHIAVTGWVHRTGDAIGVDVRVINVLDGFQLWAKRFDSDAGDLLVINERVARAIVDVLTLSIHHPGQRGALDPVAVNFYLRGRVETRSIDPGSLDRAVSLFDKALAFVPDEPSVLAACAIARARQWFHYGTEDCGKAALALAERAVRLAPSHPEARFGLAMVRFQSTDMPAAVRELKAALASLPDLAGANLLLGRILLETGPLDRAKAFLEHAITLDTTLKFGFRDLGRAHAFARDRTAALDYVAQIPRDRAGAVIQLLERARYALWHRDRDEAAALIEQLGTFDGPGFGIVGLARWIARIAIHGERALGEFAVAEFRDRGGIRRKLWLWQIEAEISASIGASDRCLSLIAKAVDHGLIDVTWLDHYPLFAPLRGQPRFDDLRAIVAERAGHVIAAWNEHD